MSRCSICRKNKQRNSFSNNQLRKSKKNRKCKTCISKKQKQASDQAAHAKNQNMNDDEGTYLESLQKDAAKLNEPGQLSFLQKLHQHCINKSVYTEMCLGFKVEKTKLAQVGFERIFKPFPDRNFQYSVYLAIKNLSCLRIIGQDTRLCCNELLYKNGKISSKGVEFYDQHKSPDNSDIATLLFQPIFENRLDDEKNENVAKGWKENEQHSHKLMQLMLDQKSFKLKVNALKRQLSVRQNKMKIIVDSNVLIKWQTVTAKLKKQSDHLFDHDNLDTFKDLLTAVLIPVVVKDVDDIRVQESEGQINGVLLQINNKTIAITRNIKNNEFLLKLENLIKYFAQQITINTLKEKSADNDNDDSMSALIDTLKLDILNHIEIIGDAKKSFHSCSATIVRIIQNEVSKYEHTLQSDMYELWNVQLLPTKLILTLNNKHELFFLCQVTKGKQKQAIKQWISQRIDKYEGICEYGVDHLFVRFINFVRNTAISFWIAVLRFLSLPVSITNLNLLMSYTMQSVDEHFRLNHPQSVDGEIDIIMVVTYFMHAVPARYQANPLKFIYDDNKKRKLKIIGGYPWENEPQIMKLCNACFGYVITLIPNYKQPSNANKMRKQIDRYMSKNEHGSVRRSTSDKNKLIYSGHH